MGFFTMNPQQTRQQIKGNFSQNGFYPNFIDLKVQICSKYGSAREKRQRKYNEKLFYQAIFAYHDFPLIFRACFFRSQNGTRHQKTVSKHFNIKIQHSTMMHLISIPTWWSCKSNQLAYTSRKNGFVLQFAVI